MKKSLSITFLTKSGIGNLNGGEINGSVKRLADGRVYVSGQMVKRSIMETMRRENPDKFLSDAENPLQDIAKDMFSDINGYLIPSIQERRESVLQVTPMEQVCDSETFSDMLLRLSEMDKPINPDKILKAEDDFKKAETKLIEIIIEKDLDKDKIFTFIKNEVKDSKELKGREELKNYDDETQKAILIFRKAFDKLNKLTETTKDNRIANIELLDAVYKCSVHADLFKLGRSEVFNYENLENGKPVREFIKHYDDDERKRRAKEIIKAIVNLTGFSKQARASVDASPDLILFALSGVYSHKLQKAIKYKNGNVNLKIFENIINELKNLAKFAEKEEPKFFLGINSNFIDNQKELVELADKLGVRVGTPVEMAIECAEAL